MQDCNRFNFKENVNAKVEVIECDFKKFHLLKTRTKVFKNCCCCYFIIFFFFIVRKYIIANNEDKNEKI